MEPRSAAGQVLLRMIHRDDRMELRRIFQTIAVAVKRGAAMLDDRRPGWRERLNAEKLCMHSCQECVVGQEFKEEAEANNKRMELTYKGGGFNARIALDNDRLPFWYGLKMMDVAYNQSVHLGFSLQSAMLDRVETLINRAGVIPDVFQLRRMVLWDELAACWIAERDLPRVIEPEYVPCDLVTSV